MAQHEFFMIRDSGGQEASGDRVMPKSFDGRAAVEQLANSPHARTAAASDSRKSLM